MGLYDEMIFFKGVKLVSLINYKVIKVTCFFFSIYILTSILCIKNVVLTMRDYMIGGNIIIIGKKNVQNKTKKLKIKKNR